MPFAFLAPDSSPPAAVQADDSVWLDTVAAARYAGCCPATLRRAIRAGDLRAVQLGNRYRLKPSWIDTWLSRPAAPVDLTPEALERKLARARRLSDRGRLAARARWAKRRKGQV